MGGSWRAGRSRREEEAAGVGKEAAPRPAVRRHLRRRPPVYAVRTPCHPPAAAASPAIIAGLAACAGRPLLGPSPRGSSLLLAFTLLCQVWMGTGDGDGPGPSASLRFCLGGCGEPGARCGAGDSGSRALGNFYTGDSLAVFSLLFFLPAAPCFSSLSSLRFSSPFLLFPSPSLRCSCPNPSSYPPLHLSRGVSPRFGGVLS